MINIDSINWNEDKNRLLKFERNISFEDVLLAINSGMVVDIESHHNLNKYPNQMILFVNIRDYIYLVPFIYESDNVIFLKTVIPGRKATNKYLGRQL